MRERWCLLLLPALLHPSAEISLNLGGKISHQPSATLAQMMLGLDEKHPISTRGEAAHYEIQGICLECHCCHPKPLTGFKWDEIECSPTARRCHRGVTSPGSYSILLLGTSSFSPVPLLFTLLKQWIFDFLSNKTEKWVLRASSTLQRPIYTKSQKAKEYFIQFPYDSLTLGSWNLDQLFGTRALSTSKWPREKHQSS